ncbi:cyclin-dependent kinase inhibitor 2A-like [Amphiura filiformis]|uniref:cyclin-dependent kinase inhibitor 2A-like n=1 Tax=Amphiura filiformis TaxID=82378 RepID=UPI003B2141CE
MAAPRDLATAAASGDLNAVKSLVQQGADVNQKSRDGFTPLCNAAFWGYSEIVEYLLKHDADLNASNSGTLWTPTHCAAFQDHGKVIMKLMEYQPDIMLQDSRGRTPVDFASALETIWPFFAAEGCKRTPKTDLIRLEIVRKVKGFDPSIPKSDYAHFSRPGSAYVMRSQPMAGGTSARNRDLNAEAAALSGDVLAEESPRQPNQNSSDNPAFTIWRT